MAEIKLSKIYSDKIHAPRDRKGNVYYIPKLNGQNLTDADRALLNNQEYMKMQKLCMNSPTNIRRIWMTTSKVVVEYYAGYKSNGKTCELVMTRSLDTNLRNAAEDIIKYEMMNTSQRTMSKTEKTYVRGRAFSAIYGTYACNNIEELYFDWGALLSDDAKNILAQLGINVLDIIYKFGNRAEQFSIAENNVALKLMLGESTNELRSTFKRLKVVAMISKLDDFVNNIPDTVERFDLNNVKKTSTPWILNQKVQEMIKQTQSEVWMTKIPNTTISNTSIDNFTIKNQQFMFDDEVLSTKISAYVTKLKDLDIQEAGDIAAQEEAELNAVSAEGTVEAILDKLREEKDEQFVRSVLKIAYRFCGKDKFNIAFKSMPDAKQKYYLNIFNGRIH